MTPQLMACVHVPNFLAYVAVTTQAAGALRPLLVAASLTDRAPIIAVHAGATPYGIHPGMLVWVARQRCPELVVTTVAPDVAERVAAAIEAVLRECTDEVVRDGWGWWTLGLYALGQGCRDADPQAQALQQAVRGVLAAPVAVGMGTAALVARLAATVAAKSAPTGRLVVFPGGEATFLDPLPVRMLPDVGVQTEQALARVGIMTIKELGQVPVSMLVDVLGARGRALHQCLTELHRPRPQQVGMGEILTCRSAWQTKGAPCGDAAELYGQTQILTERVGRSLRAYKQGAGRLSVRVQWVDGGVRVRSYYFAPRREFDRDLWLGGRSVLQTLLGERRLLIERIEVILDDLGPVQHDLLQPPDERARGYQRAVDSVKRRWGTGAILHAALLGMLRPARR